MNALRFCLFQNHFVVVVFVLFFVCLLVSIFLFLISIVFVLFQTPGGRIDLY